MGEHEQESESAVVPGAAKDSRPLAAVFGVVVVAVTALGLVTVAYGRLPMMSWPTIGLVVPAAVLIGVVAVIVTAQQWDAVGGYRNHRMLRHAVRRRMLPDGADRSWWESALAREADAAATERRHSWAAIASALLFAGLALTDPTRTGAWVVSAIWAAAVIFEVVHSRLRVAAVAELRGQLARLAPTTSPLPQPR